MITYITSNDASIKHPYSHIKLIGFSQLQKIIEKKLPFQFSRTYDCKNPSCYIEDEWDTFVSYGHVTVKSDNVQELFNLQSSIKYVSYTLKPTDVLFFEETTFPSLLLSKLNIHKLKRTINKNKADYIVSDSIPPAVNLFKNGGFRIYFDFNDSSELNLGIVECSPYDLRDAKILTQIDSVIQFLNKFNYKNFRYTISISERYYNSILNCTNYKVIDTNNFIQQIYPFIPVATESEVDNLINMLTAADRESVLLGYNLMSYINVGNFIPKICLALYKCQNLIVPKSSATTYAETILDTDLSRLAGYHPNNIKSTLNFMLNKLSNPLITDANIRSIVVETLRQEFNEYLHKEYHHQITSLDIDIILKPNEHDQIGTSESSDKQMETE